MKKIFTFLFIATSITVLGQQKLNSDYSSILSNLKGIHTIDGAIINPKERFATIKADKIIFNDRSALILANCIVIVDGTVNATSNCVINLVNSYIICKNYVGKPSPRIKRVKNIENCKLGEVGFLKKIKGNPKIQIINKSGKVVASGNVNNIASHEIASGVYDVRSTGNFYEANILLAN